MISEKAYDTEDWTEDWSDDVENSALPSQEYIFLYIYSKRKLLF